jgi:uncharacterized protein with HEPN domain
MTRDEIIATLKETAPVLRGDGVTRRMPHTSADLLSYTIDSINNIQMFLSRAPAGAPTSDMTVSMAVERSFEIISDAVHHIPDDVKAQQPDVEWRRISDLGDQMRRDYYCIDANFLVRIAQRYLPPLKAFAERIVREEDQ